MNSSVLKMVSVGGLLVAWLASIIGKHFFPDLDTAALNGILIGMISGLSGYHAGTVTGTAQVVSTIQAADGSIKSGTGPIGGIVLAKAVPSPVVPVVPTGGP
jgi:hypothetical protein